MPTTQSSEQFRYRDLLTVFANLPRSIRLVWNAHALYTVLCAICSIVRGVFPVFHMTITQYLIDSVLTGIQTHSIALIWFPVLLQLSTIVSERVIWTIQVLVQKLLQESVSSSIQVLLLQKANVLDLSFFENAEFYDKLKRANSEASYRPVNMITTLFSLTSTIVSFISLSVLLLQLAWWIILISILVSVPLFLSNSQYGWKAYARMRKESSDRRRMIYFSSIMTTDDYNKEIKLFNLGDHFIERYLLLRDTFFAELRTLLVSRYTANFVWSLLTILSNTAIYFYIAWVAIQGSISLGALTKYTQASSKASDVFQDILDNIADLYESNLFVSTVFEFLAYEPRIASGRDTMHSDEGISIEFRNVTFTYPGKERPILSKVSFTIQAGQSAAFVGRNGAGKTTIVKLLTRLYDPDEGEILLAGKNIKTYDLATLREHIGVIFQDFSKYALSVRENIGVGKLALLNDERLIALSAEKSGADKVIERLEQGYDTMLGRSFENGVQLSGGEWQKVALARAFVRDAALLILDEPTSALDPQSEYDTFLQFRALTQGKTTCFISHRFSTVRLADCIFVMEDGRVLESGSHAGLVAQQGRYAELFELQAGAYR